MSKKKHIIADIETARALAQVLKYGLPPFFKIKQVVQGELITIEYSKYGGLTITSAPTDKNYDGEVKVTQTQILPWNYA